MRWLLPVFLALVALLAPSQAWAVYAQSAVTSVRATIDGKACVILTYTETDAASTSDAVVNLDWTVGTIRSVKQTLTAGTGATLNTKIGRAAAFVVATQNWIATAVATAANISEQGATHFYSSISKLYVRASPNAGTDNAVSTELIVCAGAF